MGSIATLMTGSGKSIISSLIGASGAASVSPVWTCLIPTAAAISPADTVPISSRWLACIMRIRPTRSVLPVLTLRMRDPASTLPEYTRK